MSKLCRAAYFMSAISRCHFLPTFEVPSTCEGLIIIRISMSIRRYKLVKSVYMVASVLRKEAEAAEERRAKKLRDAEELLRKEQARMHGGI